MRIILGILFVLLLASIALNMMGCGALLSSGSINTVLTTAELAGEIAEKVDDLHEAGVDQKILDEVHQALSDAHKIIDKHHKDVSKVK